MAEISISLKNVSKCFKRYNRPIDKLKEILLPSKNSSNDFWAVQDISVDIPKGDTFGIVGRNGSGKSTLLQIIAGTLTPTAGEVCVSGRISALLELGSGFNPEFTGRQNVFFNGRLLGLTQQEVENKFDSISAFADIGDFIDQPVKTYSSGMFVRLAFAVAVNVEPEILIVDEALSVGDIFFQSKCFRKIEAMQNNGVTILFVSHDMGSVQSLCREAILLEHGKVLFRDVPSVISSEYYKLFRVEHEQLMPPEKPQEQSLDGEKEDGLMELHEEQRFTNGKAKVQKVTINNLDTGSNDIFLVGDTIQATMLVEFYETCCNVTAGFGFRDRFGKLICGKHTWFDPPGPISVINQGEVVEFIFSFPLDVHTGEYLVLLGVACHRTEHDYDSLDIIQDAFVVNVVGKEKVWGIVNIPGSIQVCRSNAMVSDSA